MRYIGSKRQVLPFIKKTIIDTYGDFSSAVIGDLFAGTACVGEMFKKAGATVISNDYMNFSYALQVEKVKLNSVPESISSYDDLLLRLNQCEGIEGFFFEEYTSEGTIGKEYCRNYFSADNAKKIDAIRTFTTESLAVFMPFKVQEIRHENGIFYGQNTISKNMIIADRRKLFYVLHKIRIFRMQCLIGTESGEDNGFKAFIRCNV